MIISRIFTDANGESHFGSVTVPQSGHALRVQTDHYASQYWEIARSQPGFFADWHPTGVYRLLNVMSGMIELGTSDGEKRQFRRGDMIYLEDLVGRGHTSSFGGDEPCVTVPITLSDRLW